MKVDNLLVSGGCGFIGANFIHYLFNQKDFKGIILNLDKLTYAGNLENLKSIEKKYGGKKYFFEKADICNINVIEKIFEKYNINCVIM